LEKVVIVGAGPSGLFAARELADNYDVTIIERRNYAGGSGLHSDGKLNFHPHIGGDLTQFLPETKAWDLVKYIRNIFRGLGVEEVMLNESGLKEVEVRAVKAGIRFIKINQNHIGSDHLPQVIMRMHGLLAEKNVKFQMNTVVTELRIEEGKVVGVETNEGCFPADEVILVPGRIGSGWLTGLMKKLDIKLRFNPIDVGVRIEVPNEVMDDIIQGCGIWDPKFHIYTPSYDDFVRTFCVCPAGFVVKEIYEDSVFGGNGHSMRDSGSPNTNFALLTRVNLTHPIENSTEYGRRIAQLANTLGGKRPLLQRLGDLKGNRRSTWDRINRSYVEPTFKEVTPGDISMAFPRRIVRNLLEGLEKLDNVMPGINSDSTLIYAPEIKFYAMRIDTNRQLRTQIQNLYVAGDGSGVSRGIVGAAATGIIAARGIASTRALR